MRIDLHVHSRASDGTRTPAEVVSRAVAAGVDVLALTDHDTTAGWREALDAAPRGLTVLPGAELSCAVAVEATGGLIGLHLLAYLFDADEPVLAGELAVLRDDRTQRAREMVERLRALGAPVDYPAVEAIAGDGAVGRPHVARALADAGVIAEPADAFTAEWIGDGGRAWVAKHALDPRTAIALVKNAGGATVFAHPGASRRGAVVDDAVIAELAGCGLDGIEVDHPDHDAATRTRLRALAGSLGLLVTGSSDDHGELTGDRIGCETTDPGQYEALVARAARR